MEGHDRQRYKAWHRMMISHRRKYRAARQMYQADFSSNNNRTKPVFAADLQKVIFIPHTNPFKRNIFTSRHFVVNETFASFGKGSYPMT